MSLNSRVAWLAPLTLVLICAAVLFDGAGRQFDAAQLWIAGAHSAAAALVVGLLSLVYWRAAGVHWRGALLWLDGLVLLAFARWLRGAAGVAPDRPLIAAGVLAALSMALGWWRRARAQRSTAIERSL
jgi:hypothetical protein